MARLMEEAFERVMAELYWVESMEEAVAKLAEYIESMDPDLREVLLEQRRKFCGDAPRAASILASLAYAAQRAQLAPGRGSRLELLSALVASAYLMQCTEKWHRLKPREKAEVLAPLYRASYALKLAMRNPGDDRLLDEVERMLEHALSKARALGILDELREYISHLASKLEEG
ncbi:hypothetical protein [Stetteria hydrogenophila]